MRWTRARRKGLITVAELEAVTADARSEDGAPMITEPGPGKTRPRGNG